MISLSVNVNKVATVRNSRGGQMPSVLDAVEACVAAGAPGITVHPRADARHITTADVREISALLKSHRGIEFNMEGDPRPDFLALVHDVRPTQCTLVPVQPGEVTSQAGWPPDGTSTRIVAGAVRDLRSAGVRVSLFVDAAESPVAWAASVHADRVELYTEPYARAFERGDAEARRSFEVYARAAEAAHRHGLGVNAGHDLDLDNLVLFRTLPHLEEVSIGHALVSHALFVGLEQSVREYLHLLAGAPA